MVIICQVIFSCLLVLYNLYYKNFGYGEHELNKINFQFNNVILLAGATEIENNKLHYIDVIKNTVRGKIYNFYNTEDRVLNYLYKGSQYLVGLPSNPIGSQEIELKDLGKKVENIKFPGFDHTTYREKLDFILENYLPKFYD